jgi:hypothetical protein
VTRIEIRCAGECRGVYGALEGDVAELYRGIVWEPNIITTKHDPGIVTVKGSFQKEWWERGPATSVPDRVQLMCPKCGAGPWVTWADVLRAIRRQPRRKTVNVTPDGTVGK